MANESSKVPRFFWQGALILLPLAVLAGAAAWMLQRQRVIFEEEERQRAGETARLLLPIARDALTDAVAGAHPPLPETIGKGGAWARLIASPEAVPPTEAGLREKASQIDAALDFAVRTQSVESLKPVALDLESAPDLRTSAGVPALPLVAYQQMRLGPPVEAARHAEALARWIGEHWPSPVSQPLLDQAEAFTRKQGLGQLERFRLAATQLRENRRRFELLRDHADALASADRKLLTGPDGEAWLFLRGVTDEGESGAAWLQSFARLRKPLAQALADHGLLLAPGLGLETSILGTLLLPEHQPAPPAVPARVLGRAADQGLEMRVVVAAPDLFYRRLDQRTRLFTLLVASAGAVGLIGFFVSRHAYRKQHRLNEMKSNFVASVSHELRAPIASVRLIAERLEAGEINDEREQRHYFGFMIQECRRLGSLIENVLDFARIEQDRKNYHLEETNLEELVRQTVVLMEPAAAEKQMRLETILPRPGESPPENGGEEEFTARVDGLEIQQALVNLVDNAIKYSPDGSKIEIGLASDRASRKSGAPESFRLWVADEGPGILRAEQRLIFDRFYRIGSELRRSAEGVGIGLSIVKHIARGHGGRVELESEPGKGARFILCIPIETGND